MEEDEESFVLIKVILHWEGGFGMFELPLRGLLLRLFRRGYEVSTIHNKKGTIVSVEPGVTVNSVFLVKLWRVVAMILQGDPEE